MKKITGLDQVQNVINNKWDFIQDVNGQKHNLSFVRLLSMSLLDIITMINAGALFYQPEY